MTRHAHFGGKPLFEELYKTTLKQLNGDYKLILGYLA